MLFHRESNHEQIVDAWKRQFFSVPADKKINLINAASDVILQNFRKNKTEYIKGFAHEFIDCFKDFAKSTENLNHLYLLLRLLDLWENEMIYAHHFMDLIRVKIINPRIEELTNGQTNGTQIRREKEINFNHDLNMISQWGICNDNFTLDLQEENIK
jgi:hypothetical protein